MADLGAIGQGRTCRGVIATPSGSPFAEYPPELVFGGQGKVVQGAVKVIQLQTDGSEKEVQVITTPAVIPFQMSNGTEVDIPLTADNKVPFVKSDGSEADIPLLLS